MQKTFSLKTKISQKLVHQILELLYSSEDDYTFMFLAKKLALDLRKETNWNKLRLHLYYLEKKGLIEERHFEDGKVDYALENPGIELVNKYKFPHSTDKKTY